MLIIGDDVGYTYTKSYTEGKESIFRSTVQEGQIELNKDSIIIEYEGRVFTIGEKGAYSVDLDKIEDQTFKLCLYTAIIQAMKYNIEEVALVTGLPIGYYSKQKAALQNSLEGKDVFIKYQGQNKVFTITQCLIFPQSAGLIATNPEQFTGDNLIIDIGGMTVDVSYFEGMKLVKYASYPLGTLKLYAKISLELMAKYEAAIDILDVERKLKTGFIVDEKVIQIDTDNFLKHYTEEILRPIKLDFPYRTARKTFIGGGSIELKKYLPAGVDIKENGIFTNARAFYEIGVEKFGS